MKNLNIKDLENKALAFFKENAKVDEVFCTLDGNVFTLENRAKLHAGKDGKVYPFKREVEAVEDTETPMLNAKDTIAKIKEAITLEQLEAFVGDDRKTVAEALEAKANELREANEPKQD